MAPEAREKGGLRLPDDVAGHPHHDVVEAAVLEVVLDAGAAGPGDLSVDHVQLAVVGPADLVLAPVEAAVVRVEAVPVERDGVVHDDLRSCVGEACEHLAGCAVRPGAEGIDDYPDLDPSRELPLEELGHLRPDLALAPSEHEDVHRRPGGLHIREDAREEVPALDPGLDRRGRRPGEVERGVVRTGRIPRSERLGRGLCFGCRHRIGRRRPARALRDPEHLSEDDHEDERQDEEDDPTDASPATRGACAGRIAEQRQAAEHGGGRQHGARGDDEQQAVGGARPEHASPVDPVLGRRPTHHERAGEHAGHADARAMLHSRGPEERRPRQEDAQPAVVRAFGPVEGQRAVGEPGAEDPDEDHGDRDAWDDAVGDRATRRDGGRHVRSFHARHAACGFPPGRARCAAPRLPARRAPRPRSSR